MWSEQRGKTESSLRRPTLEMSASVMVLWFRWVGPGVAVTFGLFVPVTEKCTKMKNVNSLGVKWGKGGCLYQ